MDGLVAVEARIAQIQGRIASLTTPAATVPLGTRPAFAAALSEAVAATSSQKAAGAATGASTTGLSTEDRLAALRLRHGAAASSSLTADGVPRDLAGYGNGKVPAAALSPIGHGGHRLWTPAAEAFGRMHAAAARSGVDIGVTDSYRSYEAQVDLAERKGLYSQGGLAAKPGTSDHGWGRALDLDLDAKAQAWMREHGGRYGFVEDTPREPWHWVYEPTR
jgi:hypothetical protein